MNDVDLKVTGVALSVLDEACDESSCLEAVIKHNPPLLRHGKPGKNLMLRYVGKKTTEERRKQEGRKKEGREEEVRRERRGLMSSQ